MTAIRSMDEFERRYFPKNSSNPKESASSSQDDDAMRTAVDALSARIAAAFGANEPSRKTLILNEGGADSEETKQRINHG